MLCTCMHACSNPAHACSAQECHNIYPLDVAIISTIFLQITVQLQKQYQHYARMDKKNIMIQRSLQYI